MRVTYKGPRMILNVIVSICLVLQTTGQTFKDPAGELNPINPSSSHVQSQASSNVEISSRFSSPTGLFPQEPSIDPAGGQDPFFNIIANLEETLKNQKRVESKNMLSNSQPNLFSSLVSETDQNMKQAISNTEALLQDRSEAKPLNDLERMNYAFRLAQNKVLEEQAKKRFIQSTNQNDEVKNKLTAEIARELLRTQKALEEGYDEAIHQKERETNQNVLNTDVSIKAQSSTQSSTRTSTKSDKGSRKELIKQLKERLQKMKEKKAKAKKEAEEEKAKKEAAAAAARAQAKKEKKEATAVTEQLSTHNLLSSQAALAQAAENAQFEAFKSQVEEGTPTTEPNVILAGTQGQSQAAALGGLLATPQQRQQKLLLATQQEQARQAGHTFGSPGTNFRELQLSAPQLSLQQNGFVQITQSAQVPRTVMGNTQIFPQHIFTGFNNAIDRPVRHARVIQDTDFSSGVNQISRSRLGINQKQIPITSSTGVRMGQPPTIRVTERSFRPAFASLSTVPPSGIQPPSVLLQGSSTVGSTTGEPQGLPLVRPVSFMQDNLFPPQASTGAFLGVLNSQGEVEPISRISGSTSLSTIPFQANSGRFSSLFNMGTNIFSSQPAHTFYATLGRTSNSESAVGSLPTVVPISGTVPGSQASLMSSGLNFDMMNTQVPYTVTGPAYISTF